MDENLNNQSYNKIQKMCHIDPQDNNYYICKTTENKYKNGKKTTFETIERINNNNNNKSKNDSESFININFDSQSLDKFAKNFEDNFFNNLTSWFIPTHINKIIPDNFISINKNQNNNNQKKNYKEENISLYNIENNNKIEEV